MTLNRIVGVGLSCLLFAGAALAQNSPGQTAPKSDAPKEKVVITNPEWEVRPDRGDLQTFFPTEAAARNASGDATIRCIVAVSHLLTDCVILSENPPDLGFGRAAIAWSTVFRLKPATRNGVPIGGAKVDIPIHFDCDGCSNGSRARVLRDSSRFFFNLPWSKTPTLEEWAAAYPASVRRAPVLGSVAMECEFGEAGRLGTCSILSEQPEGRGFGSAARALAKSFVGPETSEGKSTKGSFARLNISFPSELVTGGRPELPPTSLLIAPTEQQLAAVFPATARERNIPFGRASIQCVRDGAGRASNCTVASESPAGAGFGQAAMRLAPILLFSNWSSDGRMTTTTVRVPFAFGHEPEGQESAQTLVDIIDRAIRVKDFVAARRYADQLLTRFPSDKGAADMLMALSDAAEGARAFDVAIWATTRAVPFSEHKEYLYNSLCWIKATRNIEADSALSDCDEALKLAPDNAAMLDSRGFAYLRLGRYDKAIEDYNAVLRQYPKQAGSLMGRGIAKLRLGDTRGGNADIRAAKAVNQLIDHRFEDYGMKP